jgi:hypothetical protein
MIVTRPGDGEGAHLDQRAILGARPFFFQCLPIYLRRSGNTCRAWAFVSGGIPYQRKHEQFAVAYPTSVVSQK